MPSKTIGHLNMCKWRWSCSSCSGHWSFVCARKMSYTTCQAFLECPGCSWWLASSPTYTLDSFSLFKTDNAFIVSVAPPVRWTIASLCVPCMAWLKPWHCKGTLATQRPGRRDGWGPSLWAKRFESGNLFWKEHFGDGYLVGSGIIIFWSQRSRKARKFCINLQAVFRNCPGAIMRNTCPWSWRRTSMSLAKTTGMRSTHWEVAKTCKVYARSWRHLGNAKEETGTAVYRISISICWYMLYI